jgi:hypothetical protein
MYPLAISAPAAARAAPASPCSTASRRGTETLMKCRAAPVLSLEMPSWYMRIATWPRASSTVAAQPSGVLRDERAAAAPARHRGAVLVLDPHPASAAMIVTTHVARVAIKRMPTCGTIRADPKRSLRPSRSREGPECRGDDPEPADERQAPGDAPIVCPGPAPERLFIPRYSARIPCLG